MDPDEALRRLLEGLRDGDKQAVLDAGEALETWLQIGSFPPQVTIGLQGHNLLLELEDHWLNYRLSLALVEFALTSNRD